MDPLVLLHGFMGRGSSWDAVLTALMEAGLDQPVDGWSPDLPGHGSSAGVRPDSFESTVRVMAKKIDKRFDKPVVLAGYSMGARLALGIAWSRPELVRHLVLIGVQPGLNLTEERRQRADDDSGLSERLLTEGLDSFINYWQNIPLFADQKELPAELLVKQRQTRTAQDPEALAWALKTLSPGLMPNFRPRLLEWEGPPITLVTGENDRKFCDIAEEILTLEPAIRHEVIPDCGHNTVLEAPGPTAGILASVLKQESSK